MQFIFAISGLIERPTDLMQEKIDEGIAGFRFAVVVGVLAFAAIGASQDSTGEYCRSLYQVILISLTLSWLVAMTITPLLAITFLKFSKTEESSSDPYSSVFYRKYKGLLCFFIKNRRLTTLSTPLVQSASIRR